MTDVSEMVERVAQRMDEAMHRNSLSLETRRVLARAAIEAMREPTAEMTSVEGVHWGYGCNTCGGLKEGWQAMIDAALSPSPNVP